MYENYQGLFRVILLYTKIQLSEKELRGRRFKGGNKIVWEGRGDPTRSAFPRKKEGRKEERNGGGSWSLRRVPSPGKALSGKLTFNLINAAMSCSFLPSPLSLAAVRRGEGRVSAPFPPCAAANCRPVAVVKFLLLVKTSGNPAEARLNKRVEHGVAFRRRQVSRKFCEKTISWFCTLSE